MKYYIYTLAPTDFWIGFCSVEQFIKDNVKECRFFEYGKDMKAAEDRARLDAQKWLKKMRRILFEAQTYWEGDIAKEWVSALPSNDPDPIHFYIVKQHNNGTTFVVSPVRLLYLEENEYAEVVQFDDAKILT